jgi:hypothetical protein
MTQVAGRHEPHLLRQASISFSECPEYFITSDQEPYIDAIWKVLHASPELRMVEWRGDGIDKIPEHAPFQQLTHCVCGFLTLSIEDVLSFLATIPLIQNLSIGDISVQSNLPFDLQVFARPLLLQHLRILTVRSESISIHSLFFKITCPSLKTLHIIHDDPTLFDLSELLPFLRRSKCQLKSFKIKNGNFSEDALETLLTSDTFRSVTSLKLIMTQVSDRIVLVFMKKTDDGHQFQVLRQLEDLTLLSCKTTDGLLAEMISSRRGGTGGSTATRLRKVHVGQEVGPIDTNFLKMHNLY